MEKESGREEENPIQFKHTNLAKKFKEKIALFLFNKAWLFALLYWWRFTQTEELNSHFWIFLKTLD